MTIQQKVIVEFDYTPYRSKDAVWLQDYMGGGLDLAIEHALYLWKWRMDRFSRDEMFTELKAYYYDTVDTGPLAGRIEDSDGNINDDAHVDANLYRYLDMIESMHRQWEGPLSYTTNGYGHPEDHFLHSITMLGTMADALYILLIFEDC